MYKKQSDLAFFSMYPDEEKYKKCTHNYETVKYETPTNIHIVQCTKCGLESLTWSWVPIENK